MGIDQILKGAPAVRRGVGQGSNFSLGGVLPWLSPVGAIASGVGAIAGMFDTTDEEALAEQKRANRAAELEGRREFDISAGMTKERDFRSGGATGIGILADRRAEAADMARKQRFRDAMFAAGRA